MSTERKSAYPAITLWMAGLGMSKFQARRAIQEMGEDEEAEQKLMFAAVEFSAESRKLACKLLKDSLGGKVVNEIVRIVNLAKLPGPEADEQMMQEKRKARSRRYEGAPHHVRKSKAADR